MECRITLQNEEAAGRHAGEAGETEGWSACKATKHGASHQLRTDSTDTGKDKHVKWRPDSTDWRGFSGGTTQALVTVHGMLGILLVVAVLVLAV